MTFDPHKMLELAEESLSKASQELVLVQTNAGHLHGVVTSLLKCQAYRTTNSWHDIAVGLSSDTYQCLRAWDAIRDATTRIRDVSDTTRWAIRGSIVGSLPMHASADIFRIW